MGSKGKLTKILRVQAYLTYLYIYRLAWPLALWCSLMDNKRGSDKVLISWLRSQTIVVLVKAIKIYLIRVSVKLKMKDALPYPHIY